MSAEETLHYLETYLDPEFLKARGRALEAIGVSPAGTVYVIYRILPLPFRVGLEAAWVDGHFDDGRSYANYLSEVVGEPTGGTAADYRFDSLGVGWLGSLPDWRSPAEPVTPERALPSDARLALEVLDECREWLRSKGIDQWRAAIPEATIQGDIAEGALFVVRDGARLAATLTISDAANEAWDAAPHAPALTVHRLAVARAHSRSRLGARLLEWASAEAARRGLHVVRLDCATENTALRRFYEVEGFEHVRDAQVREVGTARRLKVSLYEKRMPAPTSEAVDTVHA